MKETNQITKKGKSLTTNGDCCNEGIGVSRSGAGRRMSSVWVDEQEDLPGTEASHAGEWEASQAGGRAHAKAVRLRLGWPVEETHVTRKSDSR